MWYRYQQNNSGGKFVINKHLDKTVFVEADSSYKADDRAMELGIYFNGVEKKMDCSCCGDRWYTAFEGDGEETAVAIMQRLDKEDLSHTIFYHLAGKITHGNDLRIHPKVIPAAIITEHSRKLELL